MKRISMIALARASFLLLIAAARPSLQAAQLPFGFEQTVYASGLHDPNAMDFAPDGRLFVGERITGNLRIVKDGQLLEQPFTTLPVPPEIPGRRAEAAQPGFRYSHIYHYGNYRSSGLEGIAFDPAFEENGHVYVYYMNDKPRRNRVARLTASKENPDVADPGSLKVLLDIPMHTQPTDGPVRDGGSHNGGALLFGPDGKLFVTVGDGWNPAPPGGPQDLGLLIGKAHRINKDGAVPLDNPFANVAGARPEIWALGFRNPYTMSLHPRSERVYVNDVVGGKETVYELVKGGNYQHPSPSGPGVRQQPLHTAGGLIGGGAWYFASQFPSQYHGSYFITDWRGNTIRRLLSEETPEAVPFAQGTVNAVQTRVGPDGSLYWLSTTYETLNGTVYRISFREGTGVVETPVIEPAGGKFDEPVEVRLRAPAGVQVRYTLDGAEPSEASPLYEGPVTLRYTARLKIRGFKQGMHPSATAAARFDLNLPMPAPDGLEMAGRWPLDDGTGDRARDVSGRGRHARLSDTEWLGPDSTAPGNATGLLFNGRASHADTGAWDIDSPAVSIMAWIRPGAFPPGTADHRILAKATGEAEQAHYWMLSTFRSQGIRLRFRLKTGGVTSTLVASEGEIPPGAWSHVAATYDGGAMRLYLNGRSVGAMEKSGEPDRLPGVPVWIGANPRTTPPRTFPGILRDVRVLRRSMDESEMRALVEESAPGREPDIEAEVREQLALFAPARDMPGDASAGREIFMERCHSCHSWEGEGPTGLSPDLHLLRDQPGAWWLTAILDPSRDIAPQYWNYRAETDGGGMVDGLLQSETEESITLRPLLGEPQTFERASLRRFDRLPYSLMPQGLESGLTPGQMASLLAFLRSAPGK